MTEITPAKRRIHDGQKCEGNKAGWAFIQHTLLEIQKYAASGCLICLYHAEAIVQCVPESSMHKSDISVERAHKLLTEFKIVELDCPVALAARAGHGIYEVFHCNEGKWVYYLAI